MIHFPDTSFFCALYRTQIHSTSADQYIAKLNDLLMVSSAQAEGLIVPF
jgi:hypothetical protein